ncbi:MAG: MerR family transcriptional regulator [Pseudomonadota bacterium]
MLATRASGKSASAFRTISEVSSDLDVPQHVLRFWETKFSQVRPLKRGGGRRYYRPEDVDLLRQIRQLLYGDGYTIKGVQRLLREGRGKLPLQNELDLGDAAAEENSNGSGSGHAAIAAVDTVKPSPNRAVLEGLVTELTELRDMLKKAAG